MAGTVYNLDYKISLDLDELGLMEVDNCLIPCGLSSSELAGVLETLLMSDPHLSEHLFSRLDVEHVINSIPKIALTKFLKEKLDGKS